MIIRKLFKFENVHIVRGCSTVRCRSSLHGHSYKIELLFESNFLDNAQMVYDFGLMKQNDELRIYGGGILSSPGETEYAFNSDIPERNTMNVIDAFRTPYRIDIMQPKYYVIDGIEQLFEISQMDLMGMVRDAMKLGLYPPTFPPKNVA